MIREAIGTLGGIAGKLLGAQEALANDAVTPQTAMTLYTSLFRQAPTPELLERIKTALKKAFCQEPLNATLHCMLSHQYFAGYYWGFYEDGTVILKARDPDVKVIGLSMHDDLSLGRAMRGAGALAYLTKHVSSKRIVSTVREAAASA